MASTITFALSGLVMVFLLVHKQIELSRGRGILATDVTKKSDKHVHHWYSKIKNWLLMVNTKNIVRGLNMFFVIIARIIMDLSKQIHVLAHKVTEKLAHQKEVVGDSSKASEYLKKISGTSVEEKKDDTVTKG